MTDQTGQPPINPKSSSALPEEERRKLDLLTARNDPRFKSDAQHQALLERARDVFRTLFMRSDHGRWRVSKTKGLAWITAGLAMLGFWNYYPRPSLNAAMDGPSLTIGPSAKPSAPDAPQPQPTEPLKPPEAAMTPPPRMPAPRLEPSAPAPNESPMPAPNAEAVEAPVAIPLEPRAPSTYPSNPSSFEMSDIPRESTFDALRSEAATAPKTVSVAPSPTPLVQREPIWTRAPKPLIAAPNVDTAMNNANAPTEMNRNDSQAGALVDIKAAEDKTVAPEKSDIAQAGVLFDQSATSSQNATATGSTSSPNASIYPPGTRFKAQLAVGVIAVQNQESPVAVKLERGEMAFGKAVINASGRVNITLLEIGSSAVNAAAIGSDGFPGVAVTLLEDSPDVVAKLWQAGLTGVSSYAQSVIQGATTTVAGGATSISAPQPNLGLSLLQGLAQTFLAPPNQNVIKYAKLEAQTVLEFLVMPGQ
jgi:hypothetical protein